MRRKHLGLIVEDDRETAEELAEILESLPCDSVIVDNKSDALAALQNNEFCFILLDLQIKNGPDSIRGHTEHGSSLLREIRRMHADHTGLCYWLPIVIVSGFAREVHAAVDIMKDGATDVIQKPPVSRVVSAKIRDALERSGRSTHNRCGVKPGPQPADTRQGISLAIPGDRIRRRTRVLVGSKQIDLTNSCLKVLLHLMVAHQAGRGVHKITLGASEEHGLKVVSLLREALKPALADGVNIISNDYHGTYSLTDEVRIGRCDTEKLEAIGDSTITELARKLRPHLKV